MLFLTPNQQCQSTAGITMDCTELKIIAMIRCCESIQPGKLIFQTLKLGGRDWPAMPQAAETTAVSDWQRPTAVCQAPCVPASMHPTHDTMLHICTQQHATTASTCPCTFITNMHWQLTAVHTSITRKTALTEDRGETHRITTTTHAGLRCRRRLSHATHLAMLARSWWHHSGNLLLWPSINTHRTAQ